MASDVEICNRALQHLGAKRITSLGQDSANARACSVAYTPVLLAELRSHPWSFAITRAQLAADAVAPAWGKSNAFQLPSLYVALAPDYPEDNSLTKDWEIEGRKLLTNESSPINLRYIYHVTDPNEMDALFREAFSASLAYALCEDLTNSNTKKDAIQKYYDRIILRAKKANAIEKIAAQPPTDEWLTVRL